MPFTSESVVVDLDVAAIRDAVLETVEGPLLSLVEFDVREFNPVYVADGTMAMYENEAHMRAHFERIHDYVHLDFTEQDLFTTELLPTEDRVHYIATRMDALTVVRFYSDDQGLFLGLEAGEPVEPVVQAIEAVVDPGD